MKDREIRALLLELIREIAPEADTASVGDKDDIREFFDLDSMDFANLVIAVHNRTNVNVPEVDYSKLFTLENAVSYLSNALARAASSSA